MIELSEKYAYIILNNKKFWQRLCKRKASGRELHSFIRRGKVGPKRTELLFFYVTSPVMEIQGFAEFVERIVGEVDELWERYCSETCLESFEEYKKFLHGKKEATFIRFRNLQKFPNPISRKDLSETVRVKVSRGGKYINRETANQIIYKGA
jgi:predicted transcriptional regulator